MAGGVAPLPNAPAASSPAKANVAGVFNPPSARQGEVSWRIDADSLAGATFDGQNFPLDDHKVVVARCGSPPHLAWPILDPFAIFFNQSHDSPSALSVAQTEISVSGPQTGRWG